MDINELEIWYKHQQLPKEIRLDGHVWISDCEQFVRSHFQYLRSNGGNKTFIPYFQRLLTLKHIIQNSNQLNTSKNETKTKVNSST